MKTHIPESQYTEWKESWRDEYLKWVCGFANAQGGCLILGKNDKGNVVGIDNAEKLLVNLPNKIRDLLGIIVDVNLLVIDSKNLLEIQVPTYSNPISYRGHYYQRSGSTLQELKAAITYKDIQRIESYPVPYAALREAILNALVHRDYGVSAPIQIKVYEDKLKIWNPMVLPEGWNLDTLLGEHASHPYNPGIANCFFRAGEIESWGRGIQRIFQTCLESDTPEPVIRLSGNDFWLEFSFGKEYQNTFVKTPVKTPVKTSQAIIAIFRKHPTSTLAEVANSIGKSISAVERAAKKLKDQGKLKYIGSPKKGYWKVLEKEKHGPQKTQTDL